MKYLKAIPLLSLLVSCSTMNTNQSGMNTAKSANENSIVVCRQNGGHLALRGIDLYLNGNELATLRTGNSREVIVPAGTHRVTFKFPWDTGIRDLEINVDVRQGVTKNVVIGTNLDGFIFLPKVGVFKTTWKLAEINEMPTECINFNRPVDRF